VKLSEMFIGQIVMVPKSEWNDPNLPMVGKVVDIAYEYEHSSSICNLALEVHVRPVVHFLGEDQPRTVDPSTIEKYKE